MQELISKAGVLLEALPYLQRFRGSAFVIKYGGSFMDSPNAATRDGVARDVVFLEAVGIKPVLVHGGGKAITAALEEAGIEARFVQGMRVTSQAAVKIVEQILAREINPQIVNTINRLGAGAKGFSGAEILTCRKLWLHGPDGARLDPGFVGEIESINTKPLLDCLRDGITPVISPTAIGPDGHIYNCNADTAAAAVAGALKARKLIFLSDVPGLLRDAKDPATLIPRLHATDVEALKKSGVIDRGMIPKVDGALGALRSGVEAVSFLDGRLPHALLLEMFQKEAMGTGVFL